ncbi:MAG: hypothetical protein IS860_11010 [Nitrosopumilus sp.]|nr:hypothetical protein [Nitrosopumilus sp.]
MREERIDYNTLRDDFSIYEVENGQILKVKLSIVDVVNKIDGDNAKKGSVGTNPYSHVITPSDIERYDVKYEQGVASDKDHVKELKFTTVSEIINIYETKKLFIFSGIRVEKIFLTNKVDSANNPRLRYESVSVIDAIEKPNFDNPPNNVQNNPK